MVGGAANESGRQIKPMEPTGEKELVKSLFFHVGTVGTGATVEFIGVIDVCCFQFKTSSWCKDGFGRRNKRAKYRGAPCTRVEHLSIVFE